MSYLTLHICRVNLIKAILGFSCLIGKSCELGAVAPNPGVKRGFYGPPKMLSVYKCSPRESKTGSATET